MDVFKSPAEMTDLELSTALYHIARNTDVSLEFTQKHVKEVLLRASVRLEDAFNTFTWTAPDFSFDMGTGDSTAVDVTDFNLYTSEMQESTISYHEEDGYFIFVGGEQVLPEQSEDVNDKIAAEWAWNEWESMNEQEQVSHILNGGNKPKKV